jgi:RNA ligase (TIGR02306 family)
MSSLIVEVCEVKNVEKHPNADTLEILEVKGWNVISKMGQYKVGDLVVFIPPDSIIPQEMIDKYELSYMKNGGRIQTVKLRGTISQGLVLGLDFPAKLGEDVSKKLGITKWQPPEPKFSFGGNQVSKKKINPFFDRYVEIENIKNFNNVFSENDMVVFTEKEHGTNARFGNIPIGTNEMGSIIYRLISWFKKNILKHNFEFVYGSHNVQKSGSSNPNHFYGEDVWGKIAKKHKLAEILPNNYIFYGEIVGEGIQDLTYSLKEHTLFIFDIKDVLTGKYLNWDDVVNMCNSLGLKLVPELYRGYYSDEIRKQFTLGKSVIDGKTIREGIVLKSLIESNDRKIGRKILKSVSEEYLLRKNGTEFK